jgi:hypothetical protein
MVPEGLPFINCKRDVPPAKFILIRDQGYYRL